MPQVDAARVRELMNLRNVAPKELQRPGLSPRTIARCRSGQVSLRPRAIKALAQALGVEPGVLTCELPMPESRTTRNQTADGMTERLSADIQRSERNAYSLVARRYGVPYTRIIELAPLLFALVAERSLRERKDALAAVNQASEHLSSLRSRLAHLPHLAIEPHAAQHDALHVERASIESKDIFASDVANDQRLDFYRDEEESDNPFVATLKRMAGEAGEPVEIGTVDASWVSYYDLCRNDALALAGNDEALANALLVGAILIKEIPRRLFAEERSPERVAWLKERYVALPQDAFADELAIAIAAPIGPLTGPEAKAARS